MKNRRVRVFKKIMYAQLMTKYYTFHTCTLWVQWEGTY